MAAKKKIELPTTAAADSTQAILKEALTKLAEANTASGVDDDSLVLSGGTVTLDDGKSRIICNEGAAGVLAVQQYSCTIESK